MPETRGRAGGRAATGRTAAARSADALSDDERAAIREAVKEHRAARRGSRVDPAQADAEVRAKLAEMPEPDRTLGERLHALITAAAPQLVPRLWYGMPAYSRDGEVVCWYQPASKFKSRYGMLGFSDKARLDDGAMWPCAYAVTRMSRADEARISALVKQAAG